MRGPERFDFRPQRNTPTVYGLKDPRYEKFYYVGQAADWQTRHRQHVNDRMNNGNLRFAMWKEDLRKNGLEPQIEVLHQCEDWREIDRLEEECIRALIAADHPLLNMKSGGSNGGGMPKMALARKRDWIELGYELKTAREAAMDARGSVGAMLPKGSEEARALEQAISAIDRAKSRLEGKLRSRYPEWEDIIAVFYGSAEHHCSRLSDDCESEPEQPRE